MILKFKRVFPNINVIYFKKTKTQNLIKDINKNILSKTLDVSQEKKNEIK